MEWIVAALSDAHMGDRSKADDCNYQGLLGLINTILKYNVSKIIFPGDLLERWQFSLEAILGANKELFERINFLIKNSYTVPDIEYVDGNHDSHVFTSAKALQLLLPSIRVTPHIGTYDFGDWRFLHGYQFGDVWNNKGILRPIAHGVTWATSILERVIPGLDENAINPVNWISPARKYDRAIHGYIQDEAIKYSIQVDKKVCYGHTHDADLSRDMRVVNCGCCVGKKADAVILFSDGLVNAIHFGE